MNFQKAELFFKKYKGSKFHMSREDEISFNDFNNSNIPDELIDKWKKEIEIIESINSLKKDVKHLYIHVPFCNSICFYCDFAHRVYKQDIVDKWLDILEIEIRNNCFNKYETIYIGGGTPSCLNYKQLKRLLYLVYPFVDNVKEYTIEVNPESINEDKVKLFKEFGINRVSLGIQSSNDDILRYLNRKHTYNDVINSINILKKHDLNNISVDLMYSLPNQNIEILNKTIEDVLDLDVPHISIYCLTIQDNTVFSSRGIKALDDELEADMYELIESKLTNNDYIHYEVSNYCKKGYESKHNMSYWNYEDFLGLSIGASGKISNYRYTNTYSFDKYFNDYNTKSEEVFLNNEDMMFENIMMSLRTIYGLDIDEFNSKYNVDFVRLYDKALRNNNLKIVDNRLICTNLEILNSVLLDFMN